MYNVSEEYLEKINSVSREVSWYGTVTLTNGTVYTFTPDNLKQGQTSVSRQLCSDRKIEIGCVCSAELKIAFMLDYDGEIYTLNGVEVDRYDFYDAEIELYFRLYLDEGYANLKIGTFIVSEPEREQTTLICTAYDYMQKFSKGCVSTIQNTPYNVLLGACTICGVELGSTRNEITNMANGRNTCAMYDPNGSIKTWRDVIGFIASMLGGNAVIKADNKLYIIPYNTAPVRVISGSERVKLTLEDYKTNYNILTAVNARANITETVKVSNDGLTYALGTNPLIQYVTTAARQTTLINILDVLHAMDYTPFSGSFFCDPSFEVGDVVIFNENHAMNGTKSIITKITLNIGGHMEMACEGDNPYRQKIEDSSSDKDSEGGGSVGDGVQFFDYINSSAITVPAQTETQIISISYDSNGKYRQEFAAEVKLTVATAETEGETAFTENDCQVLVKYYLNGQEESYHPQYEFKDGVYLLHLMYIWESDVRIDTSTFRVTITLTGGSTSIAARNIFSRIMQSGEAYVAPSNDLEYIDIDPYPTKTVYQPQENLDYSGVMVRAYYEDGHYENVTSQSVFEPANGTQVTELKDIYVKVTYTKDGVAWPGAFDLTVKYLLLLDVKKEPTKTEYYVGDTIDLSGLKINAEYSDDSKTDVTNSCTYSPANGTTLTTAGSVTVTATYTDHGVTKTAPIVLTVEAIICEQIQVTSPPTKTAYKVGETLDLTGIVVTASYSDGTSADVTSQCTFSPANGASITAQTTAVTATYQSLSDTCDLTIITFDGIEITQNPSKTKYFEGQTLTLAGLIVSGVWSDGSKEDVTSSCTFIPQAGSTVSLNTSSVEVRYTKAGTTYREYIDITVVENEISLKYFNYTVDETNKIITITSNKLDEMAADGVTDLYIPDRVVGSNGYTYRIRID